METNEELLTKISKNEERKDSIIDRLSSLEELDVIQEYIKLQNELESINRLNKHLTVEKEKRKMEECDHLLVITPKSEEDELLDREVVVCCLKCGLTNGSKNVSGIVPLSEMKRILHKTTKAKFAYDKEVTDLEYAKRRYNELAKESLSEDIIINILSDLIKKKQENNKSLRGE